MPNSLFFDTKKDLDQTEESLLLLEVRQIPGVTKVIRFDARISPKSYFARISDSTNRSEVIAELKKIKSIQEDSLPVDKCFANAGGTR